MCNLLLYTRLLIVLENYTVHSNGTNITFFFIFFIVFFLYFIITSLSVNKTFQFLEFVLTMKLNVLKFSNFSIFSGALREKSPKITFNRFFWKPSYVLIFYYSVHPSNILVLYKQSKTKKKRYRLKYLPDKSFEGGEWCRCWIMIRTWW